MPRDPVDCAADLSALRRRITELVAQNAVSMVQQAIDAVKEEGQYQAIKYLFEMIGLYPAAADDESKGQASLTQTLLDHLGLSEVTDQKTTAKKVTGRDPLKLK
jgi:collagenase-like PrtC family protease